MTGGNKEKRGTRVSYAESKERVVAFIYPRVTAPTQARRESRTLLPELGLALLHGDHAHVAGTGLGEPVEAALHTVHAHDVQVLGTAVVSAVHDCRHGKTQGHLQLTAGNTSTSLL